MIEAKARASDGESGEKSRARKIAAILSAVLWTAGFFLAFVIPPSHPLIWLPDLLLLVGFFPLLIVWKPAWPWFVFGLCNMFIGFVLEVARFLPDNSLPGELRLVRAHLAEYHAPIAWAFAGVVSVIYGLIRLTKGLYRHFKR